MRFDVTRLLESPSTLVRVPIFLALFLVVRGLPALAVYRGLLPGRERAAMVVLQSTALPLLVVITQIGVQTGQMRPENATALVGAGMLSVLVFPLLGFALLGTTEGDDTDDADLPEPLRYEDEPEPPADELDPLRDAM